MSVTLSKPPKGVKVTRDKSVAHGVRWRNREERREAKRKIEAIRRKAEQERLMMGTRLDTKALRSPKVVVALLAVLLLVGGGLVGTMKRPVQTMVKTTPLNQLRARRSVARLAEAMTLFRVHTGSWPQQRLGLFALAKDYQTPGWKGPYINWAHKDPWGTPYVYQMPLSPFEVPTLFSCGPDKQPGTNDDIRAGEADFHCSEGTWKRPESPVEEG